MKKLLIALLVVALTVPAAAMAKKPPKPGNGATPAQLAAAKNSAKICKALKSANPTTFASMFSGVNHNTRNAYGKCVSSHARTKTHTGRTITVPSFTLTSTGTVTQAGATGCQSTDAGCTLTSTGTLTGLLGGTYSSTFTILWKQATSNGAGGFCAPASGDVTLTLTGLGTLTKHETGSVCEVGATGANVAHQLTNGQFTVTGGTGIFSGATGSGTATFTQQPGTTSAQGGAVTGSETFQSLTLKF